MFLHLETERSKTSELLFTNNQEGLPASLELSTRAQQSWKLSDLSGLVPEEVVKCMGCTDLACNRVNIVKLKETCKNKN